MSNDIKEIKDAEYCSIISSDTSCESNINRTSTQLKEYKPIRFDGKLELSLADSVLLPFLETSKQQKETSRKEEDYKELEEKIHFQDIKIEMLMAKIHQLSSANVRRQQEDAVVGPKHTSTRKEPENEVRNAPANNSTACTFPECVCRLIGIENVSTPVVDDSKTTKCTEDRCVQTSFSSIVSIKPNDRIPPSTNKHKGNERSHKDNRNNILKNNISSYCDFLNTNEDPVIVMQRRLDEISKHFGSKKCTCSRKS
jgi:hypothetical protein